MSESLTSVPSCRLIICILNLLHPSTSNNTPALVKDADRVFGNISCFRPLAGSSFCNQSSLLIIFHATPSVTPGQPSSDSIGTCVPHFTFPTLPCYLLCLCLLGWTFEHLLVPHLFNGVSTSYRLLPCAAWGCYELKMMHKTILNENMKSQKIFHHYWVIVPQECPTRTINYTHFAAPT